MRMKKILSCILVLVLLASVVPLAVTPAGAISEKKILCDDGDNELTKAELVNAILPYMLDEGTHTLDDVGDAAWVYAYWDGKPKTIVDSSDRTVTIYRPLERIVSNMGYFTIEPLRVLKVPGVIVGLEEYSIGTNTYGFLPSGPNFGIYFEEFVDVQSIGSWSGADMEEVFNLEPDAFLAMPLFAYEKTVEDCELVDLPVFGFYFAVATVSMETYPEEITKLGYLFDKEEEAEEYRDWYENILNIIKEGVEKIPEEDRPKVYVEDETPYSTFDRSNRIGFSGGKNIFPDIPYGNIDKEAVVYLDPDIIIKRAPGGDITGWHVDDTTEIEKIREEIMSRDILQNVTAVKTGKVYVLSDYFSAGYFYPGSRNFLQNLYWAKWFHSELHPEVFEDLDPKVIHQEYLTMQRLDIDLDKQGVFVYHPTKNPDGN
jgi:iron complex transport system substrate-binding protein